MKRALGAIYYFLPTQLFFLHFRKYQLLLVFWLVLILIINGSFAAHFGASSLFLAPEYFGEINFVSMFLLGGAMCVFMMTWHITTFIIHSNRIPYMGATRHAFLVYSINNSLIPLAFLLYYSAYAIRYQWNDEHTSVGRIALLQLGFYLGFLFIVLISFAYFFRVSRDFFKMVLSKVTNPAIIRGIIPYDELDQEKDMLPSHSYISGRLRIKKSVDFEHYHPRVMQAVLIRHHRNVIFATVVAYILLLIMGIFMERPLLRVPAGAGFLLLVSIAMGVVGAFKYFLKSWQAIGWVVLALLLGIMVKLQWFDLRSIAYGLNYHTAKGTQPEYNYRSLRRLFNNQRYWDDIKTEEARLKNWKTKTAENKPPLVVVSVSGGGSRSAYWTFRALQYIDSASKGRLFQHTVLITGASGGMIGAAYWRAIHDAHQRGKITEPYAHRYQDNVGKDLLNSIIFSLASVDLISPFNKISIAGYAYTRDRGFAMEQEIIRNTEGLLDQKIGFYRQRERDGYIPQMVINGTIVNDGRKLLISNQPVSYLTRARYTLKDYAPPIDGVDFAQFFARQDPYNLRLTSALRMNASFPYVLPVVKLPSIPRMNIMDAGLRDNYGCEVAGRYVFALRDWITANTGETIFLEIRDTRENDVSNVSDQSSSLPNMLADPLFVVQTKWEAFQSYAHGYSKDYTMAFMSGRFRYITLEYVPKESKKVAALNFHLTQKEKEDLYLSIENKDNKAAIDTLLAALKQAEINPDKHLQPSEQ